MEGNKGGLKGYWKREKAHQPLPDLQGKQRRRRKRAPPVQLGGEGGQKRPRRLWQIRIPRRLRFLRQASSKGILKKIKDAYVKLMAGFTGAVAAIGGGGGDAAAPKEYDEKAMVELYKSIAGQGGSGSFGALAF